VVAVLREALTNIARHAGARTAQIDLSAHDELTLVVVDDGVGIGPTTRRSGLANLRARAERHRGTLTVLPHDPAGTRLSWSAPIR
jgi:signal transduction histidine kinase